MIKEGFVLSLHVTPNSKSFGISGIEEFTGTLRLRTKAPARGNAANTEIERELGRMLNSEARIVSGFRSRHKRLLVPRVSEMQALQILKSKLAH